MILWDNWGVLNEALFWGPGIEFWPGSSGGVFARFSEHFSEYCWKTVQDSERAKTDRREKVSSSKHESVNTASQWGRLFSLTEAMYILFLTQTLTRKCAEQPTR